MKITFNIIGGGSSKSFDVGEDHGWITLQEGDVVEITHKNDNWDGVYSVDKKIANTYVICYNLILTQLELRHVKSGHNKRWTVQTMDDGKTVLFRWGKINGTLQSLEKKFSNRLEASRFIHEKIGEKLKKGYNQK